MNHPDWTEHLQRFAELGSDAFETMCTSSNDDGKFCVIVEPRQHPNLISVIKNFMWLMQGTGWGLIVYHGPDNERFVKDGLKDAFHASLHCNNQKVHYVRMAQPNLTPLEYSAMLCNPMFWQCLLDGFKCKHALVFQCDTLLLKGCNAIDSFLKYDYVEASLLPNVRLTVGNSGLSLRNVHTMMTIARKYPYPHASGVPEDVYFSHWLKVNETVYWVPSTEEASAFAMVGGSLTLKDAHWRHPEIIPIPIIKEEN
jgi:hypothetical protein